MHGARAVQRVGAQPGLEQRTGVATAAARCPVERDAVVRRDMGDALADRDDGARALVAEDGGDGHPYGAVVRREGGVADVGGEGDPHPAGAGLREFDAGDL